MQRHRKALDKAQKKRKLKKIKYNEQDRLILAMIQSRQAGQRPAKLTADTDDSYEVLTESSSELKKRRDNKFLRKQDNQENKQTSRFHTFWKPDEEIRFWEALRTVGKDFAAISEIVKTKNESQI